MSDSIVIDRSTPLKSAQQFRERVHPNLLHHQHEFLIWNGSAYEARENATVLSETSKFLSNAKTRVLSKDKDSGQSIEKLIPFHPKKSDIAEVEAALKNLCHVPGDTMSPPAWLPDAPDELKAIDPKSVISCRNGLLDIETMTLYPQTPAFFTRTALPVEFDPAAACPRWETFLGEVMQGRQDLIDLIQEMFGYLISTDTSLQRIFFLFGKKRSGKGTIMRLILALTGTRNVNSATIKTLGGRFGLQGMIGKSVALVTDMNVDDKQALASAATHLNGISGEDPQTVERKGIGDWNGVLSARFVLAGNNLPNFGSHTDAMASRLLIIPFDESFEGREDRQLTDKMKAELAGILNWSLAGLHRLKERGDFVEPETSKSAKTRLLHKSNPLHGYLEEFFVYEHDASIDKHVFYRQYEMYCHKIGAHPKALQNITDDLEALFPIKQVRLRSGGARVRAYAGVRFNDEMLPKVYQIANQDLVDLGLVIEALKCDEHGWPVPRNTEIDDFSV
jgi:putative DNA primase/helicase